MSSLKSLIPNSIKSLLRPGVIKLRRAWYRMCDSSTRTRFSQHVAGKRIAVVGPAWSIHGSGQGSNIDSYDFVMRFNTAVPVEPSAVKDIGSRTDLLCNCLEPDPINGGPIQPQLWRQHGVRWVLSPYPRDLDISHDNIRSFEHMNQGSLSLLATDCDAYEKIARLLNTRPNSGVLGILLLLNFPFKEIYVTGITFGRGGYHPGYKPGISAEEYEKLANSEIHQQQPQERLFRALAHSDKRISTDSILTHIMKFGRTP